jgi:hypothetical protein
MGGDGGRATRLVATSSSSSFKDDSSEGGKVYAIPIVASKMESSIPLGRNSKATLSQNVMGSTILLVILTDGMLRVFVNERRGALIFLSKRGSCGMFRFVRVWPLET